MKKIELITPQPNIAAPVIKKPNLFPTFVAFNKKVDPANVIIEPMNMSIPVTSKLEDKSDLIISRIMIQRQELIKKDPERILIIKWLRIQDLIS